MALYAYKAMNAAGRRLNGRLAAANPADLEMRLKRLGLDFIDGAPARQPGPGRTIARIELIEFCFQLEQLGRAGVPVIEGIADLRDATDNHRLREVLADVIAGIEGGKTLSLALQEHPRIFDAVFVGMIRAGEESGRLGDALSELLVSLRREDELAAQVRKLVAYPAFLGSIAVLVISFVMLYLVPRMTDFVEQMGQTLPPHTRLLISVSELFFDHWPLLAGLPLLATTIIVAAARIDSRIRRRIDAVKLMLPWTGVILRKIVLSRFASAFAMMYAAGIPILDALRVAREAVGNTFIREGLQQTEHLIAEGNSVTGAFRKTGLFPPLVIRMLHVGETTGALDAALANVCRLYDRDVQTSTARMLALIEPTLTVVIGLLLGWVMLSVLGPIYATIGALEF